MSEGAPQRFALGVVQVYLALILLLSLFLALVVPYHATDALVFGQWSKLIGLHSGYLFDGIGAAQYSRPLFLVPQGWLWWVFGAHEWIGRLLSLAFFFALLWALFRLARDRSLSPLAPWLTVLAAFAVPDIVISAFAGQTDIPVAAMVALIGVLLWRTRDTPWAMAGLVAAAAAAALAKPTSLPAVAAIGLANLLGDRAGLSRRFLRGTVPVAVGGLIGLIYAVLMARHLGLPIDQFLSGKALTASGAVASGTGRVSDAVSLFAGDLERPAYLLRAEWFGPYLRMLVIFGLVYAIARAVTVRHRPAAIVALVLALLDYLVGTSLLYRDGSFLDTGAGAVVGSLALAALLAATIWCPEEFVPSRLLLGRLVVWTVPPLVAWALFGLRDDTRTLSPAFPALLLLCGAAASMGVAGLATRRGWGHWAAAVGMLLLVALALLNFRNYDGLGLQPNGDYRATSALVDLTPSTWTDPEAARSAADPQLGGEVAGALRGHTPGSRVWSNDGRLIFYFPEEHEIRPDLPRACSDLRGVSVVAVLTNFAPPADVARADGLDCLTPIAGVSGSYAVWAVDPRRT